MFRIVRTAALRGLHADRVELATVLGELIGVRTAVEMANDAAIRAETTIESLNGALARARSERDQAEGELEVLRAQNRLDIEDQATLRALLKAARKSRADRVFVLWRRGALHSLHATQESAELAAEAEGAPRNGWTTDTPGAALPPAFEVAWRVQQLPLGGVR